MTRPVVQVRVAFSNNPFDADASLTWTDVTDRLRADLDNGGQPIVIRRGKQTEQTNIAAGTMTLALDNRDRAFDPEYSSSPYYPNVVPHKRIQVRAQYPSGGTWRELFTGYVEAWQPQYPGGRDALVGVSASDAFKLFAALPVTLTDGAAIAGTAISHVLDAIGWPVADRYLSGTNTTVPAATYTKANALQLMQAMADAEAGTFYIEGNGYVAIHGRYYRSVSQATPFATFSGTSGYVFEGWQPNYSDSYLVNQQSVTRAGGSEQIANDAASQAAYGLSAGQPKSGMLLGTDTEALSLATWLLRRGKTPALRIEGLTLNGDLQPLMWSDLIRRVLDERVRVEYQPPGGGAVISKDGFIIGITHEISRQVWRTNWRLTPVELDAVWVLGSSVNSVLGVTTIPAY